MSDTKTKAATATASDEVTATHAEYGERVFNQITWNALLTKTGERDGWEVKATKPTVLPTA